MFLFEYPLGRIAEAVELAEYDGVEFWVETPYFWWKKDEKMLGEIERFVKAVHSAVIDLNPVSSNERVAELSIQETLYSVKIASLLSSPVTIHGGKRSAEREPVEEDYAALEKYFRIVKNYAEIKNVKVLLENSEKGINRLCRTAEEIEYYSKKFGFGVTLDLNHAAKNGNFESFLKILDRVENLHVSGYDERGRHVEVSRSEEVMEMLRKVGDAGYEGLVTIELDDLGIGELSFEEKVRVLKEQKEVVEKLLRL
ncbi:sugar phosphate isomerase/epimerase family protein [Ferroglobus placidus]|nr:sugar phosphate isomerase/epimerase [Ferroglobus placidus]